MCDWGSSRLRAFLEVGGMVSDRRDGPGIAVPGGGRPQEVLSALLEPWRARYRLEVFLCGMAGSRNGLVEVPYIRAPAAAAVWRQGARRIRVGDLEVSVAPGLQTENFHGAPDVMRGEEAQIFGALALERRLATGSHVIVLPGTHSKWVQVSDGLIVCFHTALTGELFELLCTHSSLLRAGGGGEAQAGDDGFEAGLRAGARGALLAELFQTRAAQLVGGRGAHWARAFLSGMLIGAEAAAMVSMLECTAVTVIGECSLAALYLRAVSARGISAQSLDGERCVLAGLREFASAGRRA